MVEPFATGVLSTLLPRHVLVKQSSSSFSRVAKASTRASLASNFFIPTPRQSKGKAKAVDDPPLGDGLDCQAWACSSSRQSVWSQDSVPRFILLAELATPPQPPRSRTQRTSQPGQKHRHQTLNPAVSEPSGSHQQHVSYSTSTAAMPATTPPAYTTPAYALSAPYIPTAYRIPIDESLSPLARFMKGLNNVVQSKANLDYLDSAFLAAQDSGAFKTLSPQEGQRILSLLSTQIDMLCMKQVPPVIIAKWGERMFELSTSLPQSSKDALKERNHRDSLISRSLSFMGKFPEAEEGLQPLLEREGDSGYFAALTSYLLSMARHKSLFDALQYWSNLKVGHSIRYTERWLFRELIAKTRDLGPIFALAAEWPLRELTNLCRFILISITNYNPGRNGLVVMAEIRKLGIEIPLYESLHLCRTLAHRRKVIMAQKLFATITPTDDQLYTKVQLFLCAQAGDFATAQLLLKEREEKGLAWISDITNVMHSLAVAGQTMELQAMFEEKFPKCADGKREPQPSIAHYSIGIHSHAVRGDLNGMEFWLQDMQETGVEPNLKFYTALIQLFRKRMDDTSIAIVLENMRQAEIKLDINTYTVLIAHLAGRKNAKGADALYMQAIGHGIVPDAQMTRALMVAHCESGSWREVSNIFDHLTSLPSQQQPTIETYNILLKAYCLIGAPFKVLAKLFYKIQMVGAVPDERTYNILILSASDSKRYHVAISLYDHAQREEEKTGRQLISIHTATVVMGMLLFKHKMQDAKAMLDKMRERGWRPNSVTYREIIKAYARRGPEGLELAEEFIEKLAKQPPEEREWDRRVPSRKQPLANLYEPLMRKAAKLWQPKKAEQLYDHFLQAGGEPSIGMYHYLLMAYRFTSTSKALEIWKEIDKLSVHETFAEKKEDGTFETTTSGIQGPLSDYIDILSRAGMHEEVANVWLDMRERGLQFDSHNWNHLIIALIRAGQAERAFEVMEKVLLPAELDTRLNHATPARDFTSPLSKARQMTLQERLDDLKKFHDIPPAKPVWIRRQRLRVYKMAHNVSLRRRTEFKDDKAIEEDFSYPLRVMEYIPASWNVWRPHDIVMRALLVTWLQLQRGYPLKPLFVGGRSNYNVTKVSKSDYDPESAQETINEIRQEYPAAVARVERFLEYEANRIPVQLFHRKYIGRNYITNDEPRRRRR